MTKMAAMPIYGENLKNVNLISMKVGMKDGPEGGTQGQGYFSH